MSLDEGTLILFRNRLEEIRKQKEWSQWIKKVFSYNYIQLADGTMIKQNKESEEMEDIKYLALARELQEITDVTNVSLNRATQADKKINEFSKYAHEKFDELKHEIRSLKLLMIQGDECLNDRIVMLNKVVSASKEIFYDKLKPSAAVEESEVHLEHIFKFIEKYGLDGCIKMQNPCPTKIFNSDKVLLATAEANSIFTISTVSFIGKRNWKIEQNGRCI